MVFDNGHCQMAIQGEAYGAASTSIEADTESNARAKMLIYLIEQGLVNPS